MTRGDELIIRRSRILESKDGGHEVKSRARRTVIEDSVIASLKGLDSRLIDVPNGGELIVRNSVLQEGPLSVNFQLIGYGLERGRKPKHDHAVNSVTIEGCTIYFDRSRGVEFMRTMGNPVVSIRGNVFIGGDRLKDPDNKWFASRPAAGLPAYPRIEPATKR